MKVVVEEEEEEGAVGEEVVGESSRPRLDSSCSSHFLVVPSSLRTEEKVESCSWTGRHCRSASLALQGTYRTPALHISSSVGNI